MRAWLQVTGSVGLACSSLLEARTPQFSATIVRTAYGIPHIGADTWGGIGYGVGYAYAQDNFCILAEEFVTVSGNRSANFGAGNRVSLITGEMDNLASDVFFRSAIDVPALRRGLRKQGPEAAQLIAGYVAGYNRRLRDLGPTGVPVACRGKSWVRAITTDDMLRLNEKQTASSKGAFAAAISAAAPPGPAQAALTSVSLPDIHDTEIGSNGWAFGGDVTSNGRGLLVGNPHFPWNGTNRFWQMHITIPGKIDVMGVGLAGSPLPTLGFNRDIAWTHTVTAAQHFTLYQLKVDPTDPTAYLVDGKSEKMRRQTIRVPVEGGKDVERTLYTSRFGPLLVMPALGASWTRARAFAIRDANSGNQRALGTWISIARAHNVRDIRAAVERTLGLPWVNTIAVDRDGNALHADVTAVPNVSAAMIKDCATPLSALVAARAILLDGSRSACDWQHSDGTPVAGLMPARQQAVYERRDYLANSNDSYWLSNPNAPYAMLSPILGLAGTERSLRTRSGLIEIERQLKSGAKIDLTTAETMAFANHSLAAEMVIDPVLNLCADKQDVAGACTALRGWDRKFDLDSRGAYLFSTFWLSARSIPDLWQVKFDPADPVHTPRDLVTTGVPAEKLVAALKEAAAQLDTFKTPLDARWGDVQYAPRGDQHIPIHGGPGMLGVLNVQTSERVADGVVPKSGSSYVQVVGFDAEGPVADAVLSYAQSTDPDSPYYADQTELYSAKGWNRLPFTTAQVDAQRIEPSLNIAE